MQRRPIGAFLIFICLVLTSLWKISRDRCAQTKISIKKNQRFGSINLSSALESSYNMSLGSQDDFSRHIKQEEQSYWRLSKWGSIFSGFAAIIAVFLSFLAYHESKRQSDYAQDQLTINTPPIIKILSLQVWNKGHGEPLDPSNDLPKIHINGTIIEGTAFVFNVGRTKAVNIHSDLQFSFRKESFGMNYPGWTLAGAHPIYHFQDSPPDYPLTDIASTLQPGAAARWSTSIPVPPDGGDLYVFGKIEYQDTLNRFHGIYFAKKYDEHLRDFVSATENPDGIYAEF